MAKVNPNFALLAAGYLFPEINRRRLAWEAQTGKKALRLGIGDTTEPLTPTAVAGLRGAVDDLSTVAGYNGYGDEQGKKALKEAIAGQYSKRGVQLKSDEIFVSDGAKCDVANVQQIFGLENVVAVQDPAYPVYVDTNVMAGRTGKFDPQTGQYEGLIYMPCNEDNGFTPDLPHEIPALAKLGRVDKKADLIYLCSPNNPTGAVMDKASLKKFVDYARKNKAVIIFDAAYSPFISDPQLPKSIFEIEGAKECAIEIHSFSKIAGFTGVRLGWSVVPKELVAEDSAPEQLNKMWNRRYTTCFNGASNIAQLGGLAVLSESGMRESQGLVDHYMGNARLIREGMQGLGLTVYGGTNAPYIWMKTPGGMKSWDFFDKLLNETRVVSTPGSGFGPSGEGFVRLSAFGHREGIEEAVKSIKDNLKL